MKTARFYPQKKDKYNMHISTCTGFNNEPISVAYIILMSYSFILNTTFLLSDCIHHFRDQPFNFNMGEGAMLFSVQNFFRTTRQPARIFFSSEFNISPKKNYISVSLYPTYPNCLCPNLNILWPFGLKHR